MRLVALLALLAACPAPTTGTIDLELTTAPGSTVLDSVVRLRVTLTRPRQTVEALRRPDGSFALGLEVDATGEAGAIVVEGFDANDALVAGGQSPEFGVTAIDARVVVYIAPPLSIERAPVSLAPAVANVSATALQFGAAFAGGRAPATNVASNALAVYNAYDHSLAGGSPLPERRDGVVTATGSNNTIYLFGGRDEASNPTGTLRLFDTNAPPSGRYFDLGDYPGLARADEVAVPIAIDRFIITGTPPLDAQNTAVVERTGLPALAPTGASVASGNARTALFVDTAGRFVRLREDTITILEIGARPGAAVAALSEGRFLAIGGGTADEQNDLVVIDAATGMATLHADALAEPHIGARVAVTRRHVVIAGNNAATEVLDLASLARVAVAASFPGPLVALPNDQVIVVGVDGALSLFTPPPPGV